MCSRWQVVKLRTHEEGQSWDSPHSRMVASSLVKAPLQWLLPSCHHGYGTHRMKTQKETVLTYRPVLGQRTSAGDTTCS
jgi:hypothetical protein